MLMQRLNTGATGQAFKLILLGVLFAAVAGLILTDAGGFFRSGGVSRADVAKIGSRKITAPEFAQMYRNALQQSGIPENAARQMGLPYMVLQQEITREMRIQTADKMGIRIPNAEVARQLNKQLDELKIPGTNKEKLNMVLQRQGMNEGQFVNLLRGDYAADLLINSIAASDQTIPDDLITDLYHAQNEKRSVELVEISANAVPSKSLSEKELEAYFAENKEKYRTLEQRDLVYLIMPKALYAPNIQIDDETVKAFYDAHQDQFKTQPRVRMEQAIATSKDTAQKISDAKPTDLQSFNGKDVQTITTDWYSRDTLPKELAEAVFDNKKTGIVGPIQSSLGWHVLRIEQYEDAKQKDLADVRDIIKRQLEDEKMDDVMNNFSTQVDGMIAEGHSLDDVAKEYKLSTQTLSGVTPANLGDKLKAASLQDAAAARLKESAFTLNEDETSPLIDLPNGDTMLVQVSHVTPSAIPALSAVKDKVTADANNAAKDKALTNYAEKLIGKYDPKKPASFTQAVRDANLQIDLKNAMTRPEMERSSGREVATLAFTLSPQNDLSYATTKDGITLVHLKSISRDKALPDQETAAAQKKDLQKAQAQELQQQFISAWQDKLGVGINQELIRTQFVDKAQEQ